MKDRTKFIKNNPGKSIGRVGKKNVKNDLKIFVSFVTKKRVPYTQLLFVKSYMESASTVNF
jgi:hypothetical protein